MGGGGPGGVGLVAGAIVGRLVWRARLAWTWSLLGLPAVALAALLDSLARTDSAALAWAPIAGMDWEAPTRTKAVRRADRERVSRYYEEQLGMLLERVRDGFNHYDSGKLDAFELNDLIHRYKRATGEPWKFCGTVTGYHASIVAGTIEHLEAEGERICWWERGNPPRDRR